MVEHEAPSQSRLSLVGLYLAGAALVLIACFLLFDWMSGGTSPYLGAVTFLVLPGVLTLGCLLMLAGALLRRRELKKRGQGVSLRDWIPWTGMAPGDPARLATRTLVGVVVALPLFGLMTYEGYHYTESNEFCGVLCHGEMHPEYTAYQSSPHTRVDCVECHWPAKFHGDQLKEVPHFASNEENTDRTVTMMV